MVGRFDDSGAGIIIHVSIIQLSYCAASIRNVVVAWIDSKFNSKSEKIRAESAFYKHLVNSHEGKSDAKTFSDYFEIKILKAYRKPFTMLVEEGTFISSHKGELLNSKSEWHQAKIIRTTTRVVQGGAESLRQGGGGAGGGGPQGGRSGTRTWGQ